MLYKSNVVFVDLNRHRGDAVMSSGKQHLIDERFIKDGALTEFVTDAPFFDLESPMTPYEWYGIKPCGCI